MKKKRTKHTCYSVLSFGEWFFSLFVFHLHSLFIFHPSLSPFFFIPFSLWHTRWSHYTTSAGFLDPFLLFICLFTGPLKREHLSLIAFSFAPLLLIWLRLTQATWILSENAFAIYSPIQTMKRTTNDKKQILMMRERIEKNKKKSPTHHRCNKRRQWSKMQKWALKLYSSSFFRHFVYVFFCFHFSHPLIGSRSHGKY